jgi:hypothetical protein
MGSYRVHRLPWDQPGGEDTLQAFVDTQVIEQSDSSLVGCMEAVRWR